MQILESNIIYICTVFHLSGVEQKKLIITLLPRLLHHALKREASYRHSIVIVSCVYVCFVLCSHFTAIEQTLTVVTACYSPTAYSKLFVNSGMLFRPPKIYGLKMTNSVSSESLSNIDICRSIRSLLSCRYSDIVFISACARVCVCVCAWPRKVFN